MLPLKKVSTFLVSLSIRLLQCQPSFFFVKWFHVWVRLGLGDELKNYSILTTVPVIIYCFTEKPDQCVDVCKSHWQLDRADIGNTSKWRHCKNTIADSSGTMQQCEQCINLRISSKSRSVHGVDSREWQKNRSFDVINSSDYNFLNFPMHLMSLFLFFRIWIDSMPATWSTID